MVFQLDDSKSLHKNGCFTKHPFINGCLGFQVVLYHKGMIWRMAYVSRFHRIFSGTLQKLSAIPSVLGYALVQFLDRSFASLLFDGWRGLYLRTLTASAQAIGSNYVPAFKVALGTTGDNYSQIIFLDLQFAFEFEPWQLPWPNPTLDSLFYRQHRRGI